MSEDWLVRGSRPLELPEVVSALAASMPELSLRGDRSGQAIVIVHRDLPVVWIGRSREVTDPWAPWLPDAGSPRSGGPWWTEVTGPTHRPVPRHGVPHLLVRDVARALALTTGGTAARLSAATLPTSPRPAVGHADVAPPPVRDAALADAPVDVVNDTLAILVQSRPVVALTPWLVNNHVWAQAHGRQFVLLTPAATELTHAAWSYLQNTDAAWVVDAGDAMYHGLLGVEVAWSDGRFDLTDAINPAFVPARDDSWRIALEAETTHPYESAATIGEFSRRLLAAVALESPARQGLMEPPESGFDVAELTTYARTLSPRPTRFVLQGQGWEAVCEAVPQPVGVVERVTVSAAAGPAPLTDSVVAGFLDAARDAGAETALLGYRRGSRDGHVPSRLTGPTIPAGLHLSRRRYPTLTDAEARRLGGPAVVVDASTVRRAWPLEPTSDGAPGEAGPASQLLTLLEAVQHHDSHRHAAARPD